MNIIKDVQTTNISQLETEIVLLKNQTAQNIIEIGKRLIKAKKMLSHGEWGKWLEEKVDFSPQTANKFMKVADEMPYLSTSRNLNTSKIYELLSLPASDRDEFIESNPVEDMTTRELRQAIKEKKALEQKVQELEQRPPEVVEKEVVPQEMINRLNHYQEQIKNLNRKLESQPDSESLKQEIKELLVMNRKLEGEIEKRADVKLEQIKSAEFRRILRDMARYIAKALKDAEYAIDYIEDEELISQSERAIKEFNQSISTITKWMNKGGETIEGSYNVVY